MIVIAYNWACENINLNGYDGCGFEIIDRGGWMFESVVHELSPCFS